MLKTTYAKAIVSTASRLLARIRRTGSSEEEIRACLAQIGAPPEAAHDNNVLLHHLRSRCLRGLPKGAKHFVSVGCSGTWYFEWISQTYGPLEHHTGVEFYSPRPEGLSSNVTWIANTAGHMPEIADDCADLLFSGQNIEHLWAEDVVGFLLESHRILKEGGLLVIDSPNRRITAKLGWSHPEHTTEFEPHEMIELLNLAGFDVERSRGLWLCEDPKSGRTLGLQDAWSEGPAMFRKRVAVAEQAVDSSFIWWIEARRSSRNPDAQQLRWRVNEIGARAWQERLDRVKSLIGAEVIRNGVTWLDSEGREGALIYGPYAPLAAGRYTVYFTVETPEDAYSSSGGSICLCDVMAQGLKAPLANIEVRPDPLGSSSRLQDVALSFEVPETLFGVEFRVFAIEGARVLARKSVRLEKR